MSEPDQPPRRGPGRPRTGIAKPARSVRVGRIWDRGAELAAAREETMAQFVTRAIETEVGRLESLARGAAQ